MGVYTRFKRQPGGFRALVQLLETTPASRRQKMIDVGMAEDPDYTQEAMAYVMTFEDVLKLSDMETAELLATAPPRTIAFAIQGQSEEVLKHFLQNAKPVIAADIRDYVTVNIGPKEMGAAQLKVIEITRQLERKGLVKAKKIPDDLD